MTGLRARQKADRNKRILEVATSLFRDSGFDSARMEDIAGLAEVSVGTLYNYYENKGDVLLAAVTMEVEEVLEAGRILVEAELVCVEVSLNALIGQYFDHSLVYLSKEMWRIAMATAIQKPDSPFSKHYTDLDQRLCGQVSALIHRLQLHNLVSAGIDAKAIGELFFNNLNMMFIEFAKDETMTIAELKAHVARQNRPVAKLISAVKL